MVVPSTKSTEPTHPPPNRDAPLQVHSASPRIAALDRLRGLVVALMVLDHVREYFSAAALQFDPLDLSKTSTALFMTRWVTHLCAPTFVFLAGASVHLQRAAGKPMSGVRRQLVARGLWLIVLESTVIGFGFNFGEPYLFLQVIWAIGLGMIVLVPLTFMPRWAIAIVGLCAVTLTPPLGSALAPPLLPAALWHALLVPGPLEPLRGVVAYPALPWIGVLALGYAAGPSLVAEPGVLGRRSALIGAILLGCFVLLRILNIGDPPGRLVAVTGNFRALAFVNVSKYPPSIQYVCLMLGVAGLILWLLARFPRRMTALEAFGKTPFFTYILHIYIIHLLAIAIGTASGKPAFVFSNFIESTAALKAAGWGFGLPAIFALWLLILAILRPASLRYATIKQRGGRWWLSYL